MKDLINIHADDYAYSLNTSKDIIDLARQGLLDGFSIIPNTKSFNECIELLYKEIPNMPFLPDISVHLNFVDGYSLVDGKNNTLTWESLFIKNYLKDSKIKKWLKEEMLLQINKISKVVEKCQKIAYSNKIPFNQKGIMIDSHTHTLSIPFVFDTLKEIIKEENLNIEYIRNPKEPLGPFVLTFYRGYKPINYIKNIILNVFSSNIDNYCDLNNIKKQYLWGLVMSGNMNFEDINYLIKSLENKAKKDNRRLEILFHPGFAKKDEYTSDLNLKYFNDFNNSNNRKVEKSAILSLKTSK